MSYFTENHCKVFRQRAARFRVKSFLFPDEKHWPRAAALTFWHAATRL